MDALHAVGVLSVAEVLEGGSTEEEQEQPIEEPQAQLNEEEDHREPMKDEEEEMDPFICEKQHDSLTSEKEGSSPLPASEREQTAGTPFTASLTPRMTLDDRERECALHVFLDVGGVTRSNVSSVLRHYFGVDEKAEGLDVEIYFQRGSSARPSGAYVFTVDEDRGSGKPPRPAVDVRTVDSQEVMEPTAWLDLLMELGSAACWVTAMNLVSSAPLSFSYLSVNQNSGGEDAPSSLGEAPSVCSAASWEQGGGGKTQRDTYTPPLPPSRGSANPSTGAVSPFLASCSASSSPAVVVEASAPEDALAYYEVLRTDERTSCVASLSSSVDAGEGGDDVGGGAKFEGGSDGSGGGIPEDGEPLPRFSGEEASVGGTTTGTLPARRASLPSLLSIPLPTPKVDEAEAAINASPVDIAARELLTSLFVLLGATEQRADDAESLLGLTVLGLEEAVAVPVTVTTTTITNAATNGDPADILPSTLPPPRPFVHTIGQLIRRLGARPGRREKGRQVIPFMDWHQFRTILMDELDEVQLCAQRASQPARRRPPLTIPSQPPVLCLVLACVAEEEMTKLAGKGSVTYLRAVEVVKRCVQPLVEELECELSRLAEQQQAVACARESKEETNRRYNLRFNLGDQYKHVTSRYQDPPKLNAIEKAIIERAKARKMLDELRRRTVPVNRREVYIRAVLKRDNQELSPWERCAAGALQKQHRSGSDSEDDDEGDGVSDTDALHFGNSPRQQKRKRWKQTNVNQVSPEHQAAAMERLCVSSSDPRWYRRLKGYEDRDSRRQGSRRKEHSDGIASSLPPPHEQQRYETRGAAAAAASRPMHSATYQLDFASAAAAALAVTRPFLTTRPPPPPPARHRSHHKHSPAASGRKRSPAAARTRSGDHLQCYRPSKPPSKAASTTGSHVTTGRRNRAPSLIPRSSEPMLRSSRCSGVSALSSSRWSASAAETGDVDAQRADEVNGGSAAYGAVLKKIWEEESVRLGSVSSDSMATGLLRTPSVTTDPSRRTSSVRRTVGSIGVSAASSTSAAAAVASSALPTAEAAAHTPATPLLGTSQSHDLSNMSNMAVQKPPQHPGRPPSALSSLSSFSSPVGGSGALRQPHFTRTSSRPASALPGQTPPPPVHTSTSTTNSLTESGTSFHHHPPRPRLRLDRK